MTEVDDGGANGSERKRADRRSRSKSGMLKSGVTPPSKRTTTTSDHGRDQGEQMDADVQAVQGAKGPRAGPSRFATEGEPRALEFAGSRRKASPRMRTRAAAAQQPVGSSRKPHKTLGEAAVGECSCGTCTRAYNLSSPGDTTPPLYSPSLTWGTQSRGRV